MPDVIVIGAGPAGSRTACRLAGMGHETIVLEQKKAPGESVCCTGIIGQECVAAFDIDQKVIVRQANGARLFSPSGKLLRLWRTEAQASIVDRPTFDLALAERAQAQGARYMLNSQVRDVKVGEHGVSVDITNQEGRQSLEAKAVVIATGFGSRLAERMGLGRPADFVVGAQVGVSTELDEVEVYFGHDTAPGFFAWVVPTAPRRGLVGLLSRRNLGFYLTKFISFLQAKGKIGSTGPVAGYGGIPLRPLARTYADRVIVVGDAAGQVKPVTGGGIYYGLLCADMASGVLHRALLSNNLTARSLATYEREWKAKLGQELRTGYWARRAYERLNNGQIDRIFDIIRTCNIDKAPLAFDWHGATILRLLQSGLLSEVTKMIKMPLHLVKSPESSEVQLHE